MKRFLLLLLCVSGMAVTTAIAPSNAAPIPDPDIRDIITIGWMIEGGTMDIFVNGVLLVAGAQGTDTKEIVVFEGTEITVKANATDGYGIITQEETYYYERGKLTGVLIKALLEPVI